MKIIPLLTLIAILPCLNGCVVAAVGGAAAGGYYVGQDERTVGEIANDVAITTSVKAQLLREKTIKAFDINVDTRYKVVTLNGQVYSPDEKSLAIKIAQRVNGVAKVVSNLKVVKVPVEDQ